MEGLDLTYKLIALKIKSETLDRIYFMSQVFQKNSHYCDKRKNKKMKTTKIYLILLPPLPFQGGGGGLLQPHIPQPFSRQNFLKIFFIDTWISGQRVGKLTLWKQKRKNGTRENLKGGGLQQPPPPTSS